MSNQQERLEVLKQYLKGVKGAGKAYDYKIMALSGNPEQQLKTIRHDFLALIEQEKVTL